MISTAFDFFQKLESEKWSGEVDVTSSQGHATILIKDGQFLWACRPVDRAIEKFEKISWIKLPPPQISSRIRAWDVLIQQIVPLNTENYARLVNFLKTDRLELFYRIFFWTNLELTPRPFSVETPDPAQFGFYTLRRLSNLLTEAKRRVEEWPKIQERIGSSKRIFICQITLPPASAKDLDPIEKSLQTFDDENPSVQNLLGSLPFTSEEIELLRHCDGTNSVEDLIRLSITGEFLVLRRLIDLWRKGAVRPRDDEDPILPIRLRESRMKWVDVVGALWSAGIFSLFFTLMSLAKPPDVSSDVASIYIAQALDIFRVSEGRYPLTLNELERKQLLRAEDIPLMKYNLLQPFEYELSPWSSAEIQDSNRASSVKE